MLNNLSVAFSFLITLTTCCITMGQSSQLDSPRQQDNLAEDTIDQFSLSLLQRLDQVYVTLRDHHVQAPARQQVYLCAVRGIARLTDSLPPENLTERISASSPAKSRELIRDYLSQLDAVNKISLDQITNQALQHIDPQMQYLSAKEVRVQKQLAENRYVGIGIRLGFEDGYAVIHEPFPGGAAKNAGARSGDLILKIDGETTDGMNLNQVVEKLRGLDGTQLTVALKNKSDSEQREYTMTRAEVPIDTVTGLARDKSDKWLFDYPQTDIGVIRLTSIVASTVAELKTFAREHADREYAGLIIDLSKVQNADLHHITLLADALLPEQQLCILETATGKRKIRTGDEHLWPELPIFVIAPANADGPVYTLVRALDNSDQFQVAGIRNQPTVQTNLVCRKLIEIDAGGAIDNLPYGFCLNQSANDSTETRHAWTFGKKEIPGELSKVAELYLNSLQTSGVN